MNEKVLVTGGAGFIGSHTVDLLVKKGYEVFVVDTEIPGLEKANPLAFYIRQDISDIAGLDDCFDVFRPDYIIHCAALARIQPSFENPFEYFDVNVVGTRNILELSKKFGVKRVVYSASSSAYGEQEMPLCENMRLEARAFHPYGSTKRMGEMLMRDMGKMTGGPETVCLRYFNVYGPRQTTVADGPYATVIGIFLSQKAAGKPLTVVSPGHQKRDFTHVYDVAEANYLAMLSDKVGEAEIINIGTGKTWSIWQVARLVLGESFGSERCVLLPERPGEVFATRADISKAKALLGWNPKISLEKGIKIC